MTDNTGVHDLSNVNEDIRDLRRNSDRTFQMIYELKGQISNIPTASDMQGIVRDEIKVHYTYCMKKLSKSISVPPMPIMSNKSFAALIGALTAFITVASTFLSRLIDSM